MFRKSFVRSVISKGLACSFICSTGNAEDLLAPGDPVIPIDEDIASNSNYPGAEGPANILDGNSSTKYLNFGRLRTGFIVTPSGGAATLGSMDFNTANDAVERDPTTIEIYGTNDAIASLDNGTGQGESWTLLSSGALILPDDRLTNSGGFAVLIDAGVDVPYTSFKVIFGEVKGAGNSMQIADVNFYESDDATGASFLVPGSSIIAIQEPVAESSSPGGEEALNAIDGDTNTKYLNFGRENSGFIVTPASGPSVVQGFTITTANDTEGRDPVEWELFGTNEEVTTQAHQSGLGREPWTLIAGGTLALPVERFTAGTPVTFANDVSYASYKWLCRTVKGPVGGAVDSMQIAEIQFDGILGANLSPLAITDIAFINGGTEIQLDWTGIGGTTHLLQFSTDLVDWSYEVDDSLDPNVHNPYILSVNDIPAAPKGFFRFVPVGP